MPKLNLIDNKPLARAAFWFLVTSALLLALLVCLLVGRDLAEALFDHPILLSAASLVMGVLFLASGATATALGFLSGCQPGRRIGFASMAALAGGAVVVVLLLLT